LREDVLRVRASADGELPEDASWAVSEGARQQAAHIAPMTEAGAVGFETAALRVRIDLATLSLTVSDREGTLLQKDSAAWPMEFHGQAYRVYKEMPVDEHYFGLGDKVGPLDRRGRSFRMWNTDAFAFQQTTDPIYKSIPFFLTMRQGRSLGVLLDNTWPTSFDFGEAEKNIYSFGAEGGPIDYYLLYGPHPKRVLSAYAWLTGLPPLPPVWALGFQQSRFSYETEDELRKVAERLRADRIPSDVLFLDIDFQKDHRPFTVDDTRFPHFKQMLTELKRRQFHVVAITDLHIARAPDSGYAPYDSGKASDHFVKNVDGSTYVGKVWPGPSVFPEFTRQQTRDWWGSLYRGFVSQGISGFWNDMNEPSVFESQTLTMPEQVQHRIDEIGFRQRTASHLEIHNVYGMENSRATYEGLLAINGNLRPFVLTRATYAGGQRYAATWTGDNSSTWDHLRLTTPMLLNLGLSGFGLAGADVGGFIGTPGPELLTRWTELATFQPIDRNHANKGSGYKEVWVHGPEQEAIRRHYIEERYRLMPYLYSLVEELSRTGVPLVRPLFLEFPEATRDRAPLDLDAGNEFFLGPDLLVAPAPFPEQRDSYQVKFPPGGWYDYWTGAEIQRDGQETTAGPLIVPQLDLLPVYVRSGSILPLQPVTQSTDEIPQGSLTLRVYPGRDCQGSLYLDDGRSWNYRNGEYLRIAFSCHATATGLVLRIGKHQGTFRPWWKNIDVEVYGWNLPNPVAALNSTHRSVPVAVHASQHALSLEIPDDTQGSELEIRSAE
jgi:alpha-glucosidase